MKHRQSPQVISVENKQLAPFEIHAIEWLEEQKGEKAGLPILHNHYEVIWILSGKGIFSVDMKRCEFENSRIFCVKPGQVYQLLLESDAKGFIISFTDTFLNIGEQEFDWTRPASLIELFSNCKGISLSGETAIDMKELVEKMVKEFNNTYAFRMQVLKRLLKIFLIYLTREFEELFQAITKTRDMELVQNFINLLEKNFKEKKMVAEYASLLFVTPNYLNEVVKKTTGYSAGRHIRLRVALEAKRMGRYSDACMKEIAYSLVFLDSAHFSKFFKAVTGTNFSDFKKEELCLSLTA
ncbi:MAG: helix-turn-helix domain-containing protein [Flavipsychrobacter sp.]|nr:helix-turn-helix domain-containing protein [Flavipsychrobacter sp.]